MFKNAIKRCRRFFLQKINKCAKKTKGEMFCTFAGMTSLMSNSKFCNFVKTDRNNTKLSMMVFLHKLEGCVRYIFASLFFTSEREHF